LKPARELASHRLKKGRTSFEIRAWRLDFLRKSGELGIFLQQERRYRIPRGHRHRRLSSLLFLYLSLSRFPLGKRTYRALRPGFTLELKEQPSQPPSLFPSFSFPAPYGLKNEGVRKEAREKVRKMDVGME